MVRAAHGSRLRPHPLARSQTSDHPPSIIIYHPLAGVSIIASEVNASAVVSSGTMDISAAIQWQNEMMQSRRALSCAVSSCAIVERCFCLRPRMRRLLVIRLMLQNRRERLRTGGVTPSNDASRQRVNCTVVPHRRESHPAPFHLMMHTGLCTQVKNEMVRCR